MKDIKKISVHPSLPIIEALKIIGSGEVRLALVVDEQSFLVGIVADGDVRRGLLDGVSLTDPVSRIMNRNPKVMREKDPDSVILRVMNDNKHLHIPIVDEEGRIVSLKLLDEFLAPQKKENLVVIMAGGQGERLWPLTRDCPKPLLQVGERPILETIIDGFIDHGFQHFYISVNYKAEMIKAHFGNGEKWGVHIKYLEETSPLGTAGSLSLIPQNVDKPLIVMNGDLLTKINFNELLDFHSHMKAKATMCVRKYTYQVPYGVVEFKDSKIQHILEKPKHEYYVNAGVYVLGPEALQMIPKASRHDMTQIFENLLAKNESVAAWPIRDYWVDIGMQEDFRKANLDYVNLFEGQE